MPPAQLKRGKDVGSLADEREREGGRQIGRQGNSERENDT